MLWASQGEHLKTALVDDQLIGEYELVLYAYKVTIITKVKAIIYFQLFTFKDIVS